MPHAYLHPSQRNLKTEQIGPSSHKNEYHVGVLEGNWFEERYSFGPQPQKATKFNATSVSSTSFPARTPGEYASARAAEAANDEAPRDLLFGHGEHAASPFVSMAELSYTDLTKPGALATATPALTSPKAVADTRRSLLDRKRGEWEQETNAFLTTKNVTFDATGVYAQNHYSYQKGKSTHYGPCVKSIESPMYKIGLREE